MWISVGLILSETGREVVKRQSKWCSGCSLRVRAGGVSVFGWVHNHLFGLTEHHCNDYFLIRKHVVLLGQSIRSDHRQGKAAGLTDPSDNNMSSPKFF